MKKCIAGLLCLLALFTLLCACRSAGKRASFTATVLEVGESSLLVEPAPDSDESRSSDKIYVSTAEIKIDGVTAGSKVKITYNGVIMESYPAQLGKIYGIEIVG